MLHNICVLHNIAGEQRRGIDRHEPTVLEDDGHYHVAIVCRSFTSMSQQVANHSLYTGIVSACVSARALYKQSWAAWSWHKVRKQRSNGIFAAVFAVWKGTH